VKRSAGRLWTERLDVTYASGTESEAPVTPRAYSLTHSDPTSNASIAVGPVHALGQISGLYPRLMRDVD
jgi:hypothetical protein